MGWDLYDDDDKFEGFDEFIFYQVFQIFWFVIYQLCVKFVVQVCVYFVIFVEFNLGVQVVFLMFGQYMVVFVVFVIVKCWGVLEWQVVCFMQNVIVVWNVVYFWDNIWGQYNVQFWDGLLCNCFFEYYIIGCIVVFNNYIMVGNWFVFQGYVQYVFKVVMYLGWNYVVIYEFDQMMVFMGIGFFLFVWWLVGLIKFVCVNFWDVNGGVFFICQVKLMVMLVVCINQVIVVMVGELMVVIVNVVQFVDNYFQVFQLCQYVVVFQEDVGWIVFMNYMNYFGKQIVCCMFKIGIFVCGVKIGVWLVCGNNVYDIFVFVCIEFGNVVVNWFVFVFQKFVCFGFIFNECVWGYVIMQIMGDVIYICKQFQCVYGFIQMYL